MITSIFLAVLGAVVGSFLNVVIYRLPLILKGEKLTLSLPASHCPQCQSPIKVRHNIPVVGWVMLRGRCINCRQRISPRYPLIELLTAVLFTLIINRYGLTPEGVIGILAITLLVPLFFIDLQTSLLPDRLTFPLIGLTLTASLTGYGVVSWQESLLAATLGFAIPMVLASFYLWRYGKAGMGMGDMKLFASVGAWVGLDGLFQIMLFASLLAMFSAIFVLRRKRGEAFPFGPYIILAALGWIAVFV
ncbi:prepilin peptidase [Erwinia sp. HDF1-3R]|uniref:prepilin peptidase n=1 Tax=Erwinia sp. HDF1-3R TaxID=3141543 RepID=UPI0031F4FAAC